MPRLRTLAAAAILLLLPACAEDGPRFGGREFPARPAAGPPGRFHPSQVRAYFFFNEPYGQRREVRFVATGPRRTHITQARECVRFHLGREVTAPFCFAYPSERAFRAARFRPANGQTSRNCWSARAQKPVDDRTISADRLDRSSVGEEGCPDLPSR